MEDTKFIEFLGIIGAVIAFISTFLNKEISKNEKLLDKYFEDVLSVYVGEYKKNRTINPVKFIKRRYNMNNNFIPSYIFYLVDGNDKDRLHKVLIVDYMKNFPSSHNNINRTIGYTEKLILTIQIYLYYLLTFLNIIGILIAINGLINSIRFNLNGGSGNIVLGNITIPDIIFNIGSIIFLIIILIILQQLPKLNFRIIENDYTMKIKKIEKILSKKEEKYDKHKDSYYIK